jgi:hypothetical protein
MQAISFESIEARDAFVVAARAALAELRESHDGEFSLRLFDAPPAVVLTPELSERETQLGPYALQDVSDPLAVSLDNSGTEHTWDQLEQTRALRKREVSRTTLVGIRNLVNTARTHLGYPRGPVDLEGTEIPPNTDENGNTTTPAAGWTRAPGRVVKRGTMFYLRLSPKVLAFLKTKMAITDAPAGTGGLDVTEEG